MNLCFLQNVRQIALGHAHTLVLCSKKSNVNETALYVFGCNMFGQLGTGQQLHNTADTNRKFLKSLTPIEINVESEVITLIHTKFFSNVSVKSRENSHLEFFTKVFVLFSL